MEDCIVVMDTIVELWYIATFMLGKGIISCSKLSSTYMTSSYMTSSSW
jgi:hypothetical protein